MVGCSFAVRTTVASIGVFAVVSRMMRVGRVFAPRSRGSSRSRVPLPTRIATWFVLLHQGSVLLERRPSPGVWGGLWAFPELNSGLPEAFCRNVLGCEVGPLQLLPEIEHGFTHFKLRARPIRCAVRKILPRAEAPGRIWLDVDDAIRAAVPAPVKKLLLELSGRAVRRRAQKRSAPRTASPARYPRHSASRSFRRR